MSSSGHKQGAKHKQKDLAQLVLCSKWLMNYFCKWNNCRQSFKQGKNRLRRAWRSRSWSVQDGHASAHHVSSLFARTSHDFNMVFMWLQCACVHTNSISILGFFHFCLWQLVKKKKNLIRGAFFQQFWISKVIITAHAHKSGVFLYLSNCIQTKNLGLTTKDD